MKIEYIRLKNFKALHDVEMKNIPNFCVFVGANGVGKSTFFSLFEFLQKAFETNVTVALNSLGGVRGMEEVRSRNSKGPIEIVLKFRKDIKSPLVTYELQISSENGRACVDREILSYRRKRYGKPWRFLYFRKGEGEAVTNEWEEGLEESSLIRENQKVKSPDILAIKGLSQFENFPAVSALGNLIENWHVSDIKIDQIRQEQNMDYCEQLSRNGDNLSLVLQYLNKYHPDVFSTILQEASSKIPGLATIESKTTEDGKVLLKVKDGSFSDPFLAKFVSDGTIKMLAYLVLLNSPINFPLLCVEEPENQLYPKLLEPLAEEFRQYALRGGQVFVSTHSPDFLDALYPQEVYLIEKKNGYSRISSLKDNSQIVVYVKSGDPLGYLWKRGDFGSYGE